jgi:hypothetical protein
MNKMIIFLCLIITLVIGMNYTSHAQTAYPSDPNPAVTGTPGTGPIEASGKCKNDENICRQGNCCPKGKCNNIGGGCKS